MRDDDVPVKTHEGVEEIKTRASGLAPRMRTALLLVDGVKPVRELEPLLAASGVKPGTLEILIEKGMIRIPRKESISMPASVPAPNQSPEPEVAARAEPAPEIKPAPHAVPAAAVEAIPAALAAQPATKKSNPKALPKDAIPKAAPLPEAAPQPKAASKPNVALPAQAAPIRKAPPAVEPKVEPAMPPKSVPIAPRPVTSAPPPERGKQQPLIEPKHEFPDTIIPPPPPDMKFIVARAHLANALDDNIDAYILKQIVTACNSRTQLVSLFDAIERVLNKSLGKVRCIEAMRAAKFLLGS